MNGFEGPEIVVIENPESVETESCVGQDSVADKSPDTFPALIASHLVAGASGWWMQSLAVQQGLAYGDCESCALREGAGLLNTFAETRTEMASKAVRLILDGVGGLRRDRGSKDALGAFRATVLGRSPLSVQTPSSRAARLANTGGRDLEDGYVASHGDELSTITARHGARVAREPHHGLRRRHLARRLCQGIPGRARATGPCQVRPLEMRDPGSPHLTISAKLSRGPCRCEHDHTSGSLVEGR